LIPLVAAEMNIALLTHSAACRSLHFFARFFRYGFLRAFHSSTLPLRRCIRFVSASHLRIHLSFFLGFRFASSSLPPRRIVSSFAALAFVAVFPTIRTRLCLRFSSAASFIVFFSPLLSRI